MPVALSGALATTTALGLAGTDVAAANASSVAQVQNINHIGAGSNPSGFTAVGPVTFFTAYKPGNGRELWKTDGTAGGTALVKDIKAGPDSSYPRNLTNVGGTLYFTANDGANGTELWKSDGTDAGTVQVKNIESAGRSGYPINLTNVGGTLYFTADDGSTGTELWKSDGTSAGTTQVSDINPGFGGSYPHSLTNVGGTLYFTANDGTHGNELWKSDGTSGGTALVKDINPGPASGLNYYYRGDQLTNAGGTLYFVANDGSTGRELWKSDGTNAGTVQVKDIDPGSANGSPANLTDVGGTLFFSANDGVTGRELWKSDGTNAGTVQVKDIDPGSASGMTYYYGVNRFANVGGTLYFAATDGTTGAELWKSDGSSAGTVAVKDVNGGYNGGNPRDLTNVAGTLFFAANDGTHGIELWKSDGTDAGTVLVKDVNPGAGSGLSYAAYGYGYNRPSSFTAVGGTLYFAGNDGSTGSELWKSDGTSAGTVEVKDINTGDLGSYPRHFANVGSTLYFTANDGTHGVELWKSDGTAAGTTLVKDVNPGSAGSLRGYYYANNESIVNVGGTLYFAATDGTHGTELWKSDGTAAGTVQVSDINPDTAGSYPLNLTNANGQLFFTASDFSGGRELWKSDGTSAGTVQVKDINPGEGSALFGYYRGDGLTNVGGTVYFVANDGSSGRELWKSDGTSAGTVQVKDINPGSGSAFRSGYSRITDVGGTLYFAANDGTNGTELWKSNGTAAGTVQVDDINPGSGASYPRGLTNVGGALYFSATDGTHGSELWKSDGSSAGTVMVKDIFPGAPGGVFSYYGYLGGYRSLVNVGGTLYFTATDGTAGVELWKSDGTSNGTVQVRDINPGSRGSYPRTLTNVGGTLFFAANDGSTGWELWQSDGTSSGTVLVQDIRPGSAGSLGYGYRGYRTCLAGALLFAAEDGKTLFFAANDGTTGTELWKATSSGVAPAPAPAVSGVSPSSGPAAGGTSVTISGSGFTGASAVKFGSANASSYHVDSDGQITAVSPAGSGTVDVTVTTGSGSSQAGQADRFTYNTPPHVQGPPAVTGVSPSSGPASGGTSVTIAGSNFNGATGVVFGSTAARSFHVDSDSQITAVSPAGSGTVDIVVTTPQGTNQSGQADRFTYVQPPPPAPDVAAQPASPSSASAAGFSGSVDPNGLVTTAHWEYGLDPKYRGPGFSGSVFDQSTPNQVVGSDTSTHTFSASVGNLIPNAVYHVRLVATNSAGTTISQDQTFATPAAPAPPPPVLGKSENLAPAGGSVFVQVNGQFVPLTQARQLPSGTVVDSLKGTVNLSAAAGKGKSWTGTFGGAVFKLTQGGVATKGLTTLSLVEGAFAGAPSYADCKAKPAADGSAKAGAARLSSRVLQTLRSSEHGGRFRTVGRFSAGTVRGTVWNTTDRCDGTLTTVKKGVVTVTDFVSHKIRTLRAGQSYLAKAKKP